MGPQDGHVLDSLPKSSQGKAKSELQAVFMAETREQAHTAFDQFIRTYQTKYPKADNLLRDREALFGFLQVPGRTLVVHPFDQPHRVDRRDHSANED